MLYEIDIAGAAGAAGAVIVPVEYAAGRGPGARPIDTWSSSTSPVSSQYSLARPPEARQRRMCDTPDGTTSHSGLLPVVAAFMKPAHAGTATTLAKPRRMICCGRSKPTHTPAASCGVKPMNHASA